MEFGLRPIGARPTPRRELGMRKVKGGRWGSDEAGRQGGWEVGKQWNSELGMRNWEAMKLGSCEAGIAVRLRIWADGA